ncbi:MAG TPA: FtsW/RodA/SpoVE family cell cycle protein, partial [Actinomycetota bacterium]|nr:FtsW/RodA/SpoVE family cell cycle protein [Actinomycetota bacterium]
MTAQTASTEIFKIRFKRPYGATFFLSVLMVGIGLVMILSASSVEAYKRYGSSFLFFNRQMVGVVVGFAAMIFLARIDYRSLRRFVRPAMAVSLLMLVAVLMPGIGATRGGSSRWLILGPLSIQP